MMVHLEDVDKVYRTPGGAVRALAGITLQVPPGEFVVVRGPSGCGKTTLLNLIGGLTGATSGRVRVAGALVGNNNGRVVRIDDYHVDVAPEGWMLVMRNRDVPGVIGRVGTVLGGAGINIASYHQARRATPGEEALAAINVDQALTNGVLGELQRLPDVLDVRLASFGD